MEAVWLSLKVLDKHGFDGAWCDGHISDDKNIQDDNYILNDWNSPNDNVIPDESLASNDNHTSMNITFWR